MQEIERAPTAPDVKRGGHAAAAFVEEGSRPWLFPLLLLAILLAPLLRAGLPVTQAGLLPLSPTVAERVAGAPVTCCPIVTLPYALSLALALLLAVASVALLARQLWGPGVAWWSVSLWLLLPLTASLLYQRGWYDQLLSVALLGLAMLIGIAAWRAPEGRRLEWIGLALILALALGGLWDERAVLRPVDLLGTYGPDPDVPREWLAAPSRQLGTVPLAIAFGGALLAWPRRREPAGRRLLALVGGAIGAAIAALVGGPLLLWLALATLLVVLAASGLFAVAPRYDTLPIRLALLFVAALAIYPSLRPAWRDAPPAPALDALVGDGAFWLVDVESSWAEGVATVELTWQATGPIDRDYSAFVHLLDAAGERIGQADALLLDPDERPSNRWPRGHVVRQRHTAEGVAQPAVVRVGLYDGATGERLPLERGDGSVGDSIDLPVGGAP